MSVDPQAVTGVIGTRARAILVELERMGGTFGDELAPWEQWSPKLPPPRPCEVARLAPLIDLQQTPSGTRLTLTALGREVAARVC